MTSFQPDGLAAQFAALHAERAKSWEPARLADNLAQRRALVSLFDPSRIAQAGEQLEPFVLVDDGGDDLPLDHLVAHGPALLIFFRFGECPACNIALPYYDRRLVPALVAAGVAVVAVSPQSPDRLRAFRERAGLSVQLASDPENRLARRLGITFRPSRIPDGPPPAGWVGELTPQPSPAQPRDHKPA